MKLRIVVPGGAAPLSGGSLYDAELARALRAQGHDAQVCEEPEHDAVNLFDGLGAPQWAPRLREFRGVKVALIHQPMSALHSDASRVDAECSLLAACVGVQFVSARAEADTRAQYGRLPHTWVSPPGIEHFTPQASRFERRIIGNGNLWAGKGVLEALERVALLEGPWHFDWLGALDIDVDYTARVLATVKRLNLESRVTFHGRVSLATVAEHLSRAAVCVTMSRYESWGLSLAEALRAGVPVIGDTPAGVLDFTNGRGARPVSWLQRVLDGDEVGLRAEAREAGEGLPSWADCAAITLRNLRLVERLE